MPNDIGQWLKERCDSERLSLRQAAARIGVSHGTIAKIMDGASPSPLTIRRLVRAFAVQEAERLALEDHLLVLAGYRTPRKDDELNCPKPDESGVPGR
jgi:transcriptional regulator with XRE-family HTH domain